MKVEFLSFFLGQIMRNLHPDHRVVYTDEEEQKVAQVESRLMSGQAIILFDEGTQTCNIVSSDDPLIKSLRL